MRALLPKQASIGSSPASTSLRTGVYCCQGWPWAPGARTPATASRAHASRRMARAPVPTVPTTYGGSHSCAVNDPESSSYFFPLMDDPGTVQLEPDVVGTICSPANNTASSRHSKLPLTLWSCQQVFSVRRRSNPIVFSESLMSRPLTAAKSGSSCCRHRWRAGVHDSARVAIEASEAERLQCRIPSKITPQAILFARMSAPIRFRLLTEPILGSAGSVGQVPVSRLSGSLQ